MKICSRCGSYKNIESHHIIFKSKGGKDDKSNRVDLCRECHDFIHAEASIAEYLEHCEKYVRLQGNKLKKMQLADAFYRRTFKSFQYYKRKTELAKYRLKVLRKLNTIPLILKHGYRSYWTDPKCRSLV